MKRELKLTIKTKNILILFCLIFSSCLQVEYSHDEAQSASAPGGTSSTNAICSLSMGFTDYAQGAGVVTFNGSTFNFSSDGTGFEYEVGGNSLETRDITLQKYYAEFTYLGGTGAIAAQDRWFVGMVHNNNHCLAAVSLEPDLSELQDSSGTTLQSGVNISPGYIIGVQVDTASNTVYYKDNQGHSGSLPITTTFGVCAGGTPSLVVVGATMPDGVSSTRNFKVNYGNEAFALTPPLAGAKNWCGDSIN